MALPEDAVTTMAQARFGAAALAALFLVAPSSTRAQWTVSAGVRTPRFSGAAAEPHSNRSLRPYRPTMLEVGVEHGVGRVGVGIHLHYASSSLALEGGEALAAIKDAITVYGLAPEISLRLSRLGPEGVIQFFTGPLVEVWKLPDVGSHWRVGLAASVGLEVPFGGRWFGAARVGAAVTPASPFRREDLEPPLEPRALWRREASAMLRYRL
jgi:hypothetical protein